MVTHLVFLSGPSAQAQEANSHFQCLRGVSLPRVATVTSAMGCSSQVMKPQESGCKMEKVTKSLMLFFFLVFKQSLFFFAAELFKIHSTDTLNG